MATVVVIRPGCTDYDDQHRIQGSLELPLNERGCEQVDAIVDRLTEMDLDVIYSPPTEPALSTAAAIGEALGVPVKEKEGLRNLDQGLWQGLTFEEIRRKFPKVYRQWLETPETICPPEGETVRDAMERIRKTLAKPLKKKEKIAVVVSEPLATLIACFLTGCRPGFPRVFETESAPCIETFQVDGELAADAEPVAVHAGSTNDSPRSDRQGERER